MWKRIRYRGSQALSIALLAALVSACAVFAPLYDRATQQALVSVQLAQAPIGVSGLTLTSAPQEGTYASTGSQFGSQAPTLKNLEDLVSPVVRRQFAPEVANNQAVATLQPSGQASSPSGPLLWRAGFCGHVAVVVGRCPTRPGEIAVSTADARLFGYHPGMRVPVNGDITGNQQTPPTVRLRVVGVYRQVSSRYWFGLRLTGSAGLEDKTSSPVHVQHDIWLTDRSTFGSAKIAPLPGEATTIDFTLRQRATGVDQLLELAPRIRDIQRKAASLTAGGVSVSVYTGLPEIAGLVVHERDQSRVTIPLLMLQLGLLAVVVLWLVLGAATEQRRPEVALVLLRGRGRKGARRLVSAELVPVVLAGVPVGFGAALVLSWAARSLFLPGEAPFELRLPPLVAVVAVVVLLVVLVALQARRVSREPVETLLRNVPPRSTGWGFGALETLLLAFCGTAVVAFVTGGLSGPIALVAPALLALVVGLLLAHLVSPVAALTGRRLLRRGRVALGVSVLDAARSPATRRTVAIVTVAAALLVFSADALEVGARNRALAAEQVAGAPLVAEVTGSDLNTVTRVLHRLDPGGKNLTPVVRVNAPNQATPGTLAVEPSSFRRIALFPGRRSSDVPWSKIAPPAVAPIKVTGTRLTGEISTRQLFVTGVGGGDLSTTITLQLAYDGNNTLPVPLRDLDQDTGTRRFSAPVNCAKGCLLSGVRLGAAPGSSFNGTLALRGLRVDGSAVPLGPAKKWQSVNDKQTGELVTVRSPTPEVVTFGLNVPDVNAVTLHQAWFPTQIPALTSGSLPPGSHGRSFQLLGLDGETHDAVRVGTAPPLPASTPGTVLVNLDVISRGSAVAADDQLTIWFARDDPAELAPVRSALRDAGISLLDTRSLSEVRRGYDQSTAAWSLQLAVMVGAVGLLIAILVLLVIAATTLRLRSRDLGALRMSGLGRSTIRRVAVVEQLLPLGVAVVAGVICGVLGAHFALPSVPLFATAPTVSTLDLSTAWPQVAIAAGGAAVVLALTGWLVGRALAGRATLQRIREGL